MKKVDIYANIKKFRPVNGHCMEQTQDDHFAYVRLDDHKKLVQELAFERTRLKRAGKLVADLKAKLNDSTGN